MNDKYLGYTVLGALTIIIVVLSILIYSKLTAPVYSKSLIFEKANTLNFINNQDPVRLQGFEIGYVKTIYKQGLNVKVDIVYEKPFTVYKNYIACTTLKGVMGERYLDIYPGDPEFGVFPSDSPLVGTFIIGPTEALAYMQDLHKVVKTLNIVFTQLLNGTSDKAPLPQQVLEIASQVDKITQALTHTIVELNTNLLSHIDSVQTLTQKTLITTDQLSTSIPNYINQIDTIIPMVNLLLERTENVTTQIEKTLKVIDPDRLQKADSMITQVQITLQKLQKTISTIQKSGFDLQVKFAK